MVRATSKGAPAGVPGVDGCGGFPMGISENDPRQAGPSPLPRPETSELAARIERARKSHEAAQGGDGASRQNEISALSRGLRIATEFVAAILVGTGIGYGIDQVAGTGPWGMLAMFGVGFAAGILNVIRVVAELADQTAASAEAGPGKTED